MKQQFMIVALLGMLTIMLGGCGGQDNTADPNATPAGTTDTNRFWIFPNPVKDPATSVYTTNDASYAQAYYAEIDPLNERDTLANFKLKNGFGTTVAGVSEVNVIFRDAKDLGYGRKMTVRFTNSSYLGWPGTHWVAIFVENYQVVPFAGDDYTALNLEAAISGNTNYHVGTNAIEYTVAPNGLKFAKFYTYAPGTGARLNTVNLDGRGQKAMPSVCINCHGGRGDPLYVSRASGSPVVKFPNGGFTKARLHPIEVDAVEFWGVAPYRRADQEEALRQVNYAIFCAHSLGQAGAADALDNCRPAQIQGHDYQGATAEMIKAWYSSGALNTPNTAFSDTYVPTGWVGYESLYNNVVAPYCRVCHVARGTENQSDIDFTSYAKFSGYADRIKAHVYERGNMPLGLIIYKAFWNSGAPEQLADWLTSVNASYNPPRVGGGSTGKPVQPSGELTDPTFLAAGATNTPTYAAFPKPTTFATIKGILQNTNTVGCTGCHLVASVGSAYSPPIGYDSVDRDGDGDNDAQDDYEFYKALRARVNLTDMLASPLLRRPSTLLHGAGYVVLDTTATGTACNAPGAGVWPECLSAGITNYSQYATAVYNTFRDWIEHGAPYSYSGATPVFNPP